MGKMIPIRDVGFFLWLYTCANNVDKQNVVNERI